MADSLVDLKSQVESNPAKAEAPAPVPEGMVRGGSVKVWLGKVTPPSGDTPDAPEVETKAELVAAPVRGDDVMDAATKHAEFSDGDIAKAKLIQSSLNLLIQKGQQDPKFGEQIAKTLSELHGEDYATKAVDEADKIKIEYLKKTDPEHFNGEAAAVSQFINSATFGSLTKIYGAAGALIQGKPYEEVVQQQAEKLRLLQKEYPKSNLVGELASYLIPGSPVRSLFEASAKVGAKGVASILSRVASNPNLMAKAVGMSAGAGAAGAGAVGAVKGYLGTGDQAPFNLDRSIEEGLDAAKNGGLIGAMIPPVGATLSAAANVARPHIRAAAQTARRAVGKLVEELSNTPAAALRLFNRDPVAMKAAANTEAEIGKELTDFLLDKRKSKLPELEHADQLLDQLPDVPAGRLLSYLRSFKKGSNKQLDSQVDLLHDWADRIERSIPRDPEALKSVSQNIERKRAIFNSQIELRARAIDESQAKLDASRKALASAKLGSYPSSGSSAAERANLAAEEKIRLAKSELDAFQKSESKRLDALHSQMMSNVSAQQKIPASQMRKFVDELQDAAKDAYGKESNMVSTALKVAGRRARMEIVDAAKGSGEIGNTYVDLMNKASDKIGILKYVSKQLGKDPQTMEAKSQQFIDRLFGNNKEFLRSRMADLDTKFGTNFVEKARLAQLAQDAGEGGIPSYFSNSKTGRSHLATKIGGAIGGGVGALLHGVEGGFAGTSAGAAAGAAAGSPRVGAKIIGASDSMTGLAKRMVANPEAIARLAGNRIATAPQGTTEALFRPGNAATKSAYDAANKGIAALRVPIEVRRMAQEIQKTLIKDGPKSAMSTIRVIADTPYFLGLVHYYDIAERKTQEKETKGAISYMKK